MTVRTDAKTGKVVGIDRWVTNFVKILSKDEAMTNDRPNRRLDAGETAILTRQLTDIIKMPFNYKFPPKKAREIIPYRSTVNSAARTGGYNQYEFMGKADYVREGATRINKVTAQGYQTTKTIESIAISADFTVQELREAAFANVPLDTMKLSACRKTIEDKLDSIATLGESKHNHEGVLNHTYQVSVSYDTGAWSTTAIDNIRKDIAKLWKAQDGTTIRGVHKFNALLIPQSEWQFIQAPMNSTSEKTLAQWLLENLEGLTRLEKWDVLNNAGASGTTRVIATEINDMNYWLEVPQEFEIRPPTPEQNLSYEVVCRARTGGVFAPFPRSIARMDGV